MKPRCLRHGQVEIGVVEHDGSGFAAFGDESQTMNSRTEIAKVHSGWACPRAK